MALKTMLLLRLLQAAPQASRTSTRPGHGQQAGFSMAMVMLVLLTLILGSVAIASRTTSGLLGANLQSKNREARDVAEAGIVQIVGELNKETNRALLVAGNTGAWNSAQVSRVKPLGRLASIKLAGEGN